MASGSRVRQSRLSTNSTYKNNLRNTRMKDRTKIYSTKPNAEGWSPLENPEGEGTQTHTMNSNV